MSDIDLIPTEYRRFAQLRSWLRKFAVAYIGVLLLLIVAKLGISYSVHLRSEQARELKQVRSVENRYRMRLGELQKQQQDANRRLAILSGLREGISARELFEVVDRALDDDVWFNKMEFRRKGEMADKGPEAVQSGLFIVLPSDEREEGDRGWLVHTHMEISAQARDHSALASFVRRLIDQPEIEEVRVLNTRIRRNTDFELVDFELAVVLRSQA